MKKIKLYDYQQEMLDNVSKVLTGPSLGGFFYNERGKRVKCANSVMVQMPTGTGKTYVMAAIVRWFLDTYPEGEVWLIAHRKELVEQMQQTLDRFGLKYVEKDEKLATKVRIRVLSIQWLTRHLGDLEKKGYSPGLIMVDEAHHALAVSYQDMFVRNPNAFKVGMTATPCRMKKASFGTLFYRLLPTAPTCDFIKLGFLSPYNYVVIGKASPDQQIVNLLKGRGSDGDYAVKEMDEKLNIPQAIQRLYGSVKKYADGKKGIVYAIDIDHAKAIAACYCALGINAVALDSKTAAKKRKEMVEAFKNGELDCLVNVNLFDEGFDCPDVEYIQMARPTLSLAKYLQMVGRGLRINKEDPKKVCMIIDNVGNYRKFGLPDRFRDWTSMFEGKTPGKGAIPSYVKKVGSIITVKDEMVMVKKAETDKKKLTPDELKTFKDGIVPFRDDSSGLMGLRSGNEIVLPPMYSYISDFNGNYAVFRPANSFLTKGIIDKYGYVVVPAEYQGFIFLTENKVLGITGKGGTDTIML